MTAPISFAARTIRGDGRGKGLGVPTINLILEDCPAELQEGIYACRVTYDDAIHVPASMHYGPRPVFGAEPSCEIHLLDRAPSHTPDTLDISVIGRIRDVKDFPSVEALMAEIAEDNRTARAMLGLS